ncbi:MAG: DUF885 domain-containing protein [Myxococcales bacterium]|nr:DUF885 domain-containing protein [Myxococcales bacterium]
MITLVSSLWACAPKAVVQVEQPPTVIEDTPAVVGTDSPLLRSLLMDHWDKTMRRYPTWANRLGDRRFDDQLYDPSEEAHVAWLRQVRTWSLHASSLPDAALSPRDAITRDLLLEGLQSTLATEACQFRKWSLSARNNAMSSANQLAEDPRLDTPEDAGTLLARYRRLPAVIGTRADHLAAGVQAGWVGNRASMERVVAMLADQLALPVEESPLYEPASKAPEGWEGAEAWRAELRSVIADEIRPALTAYQAVVEEQLLPGARQGAEVGVHALPEGKACYEALIRSHTSLERTADQLHQLGLDELASIHAEFEEIGERALGTADLQEIFERLRTDEELRFETAEEVQQTAEDALARAEAVMGDWFGTVPQAECTVKPVPDYLAPYTTIAYYQPARPDGSMPGVYYVNVYEPHTRPRHEAEVLAFHESIPGHHLQIAIAQELGDLPAFRRHGRVTAFVEGWALYTERLSDEMGLYTSDTDRLGMLSFDAWRAARLVVDTGLHAKGWTREQAEAFMVENTPLARNNIVNEVDRYITTPGQALAYKVGQLEILGLRRRAEAALADDFDISAFHDEILGSGPLPLPMLADRIDDWIAATARESGADVDPSEEISP